MAVKLADAIVFLSTDDKKFTDGMKRASRDVDKLGDKAETTGSKLSGMFRGGVGSAMAYGAGIFAAYQVLSFVAGEIKEAQLASQQLDAVLRSTGGAAGVTAEQVNALGDRLASLSNFSDDAIISGSSLMLTFTQIGSAVFPRAMQAALDLATAMNTDMKSAVLQVGKALNDPVKGMNALTRAGIQFTESQRTAISEYIKANDLLSAQGVILAELEKQLGGSAAAAANTFTGSVQDLMDALGNLAEELEPVLNLVTRVVEPVLNLAERAVNGFTSMAQAIKSPLESLKMMTGYYDNYAVDAALGEKRSKERNEEARRRQAERYGTNLTTSEGITQAEYDKKYLAIAAAEEAARATAEAARATEAARIKGLELTQSDKSRMAYRSMLQAQMAGTPEYGPMTMEEAAESAASQYRGYSHRAAQRMRQPQRGGPRVVISHANFTAGPDQIRAYNQRRAMMPGF